MRKIDNIYTGAYARSYEADRVGTVEWAREQEIIGPMLHVIKRGDIVLDIAAGTGRWLPVYAEIGAKPILLDVSEGMLVQAKKAAHDLGLEVSTIVQSALDAPKFPNADWAVTTRFLNWVPLRSAREVLEKCVAANIKNFLLMVTYLPAATSRARALKHRLTTFKRNIKSALGWRKKGIYYLSSEQEVRDMIQQAGLAVKVERVISDTGRRRNVLIWATRADAAEKMPTVTVFDTCHVDGDSCLVNGQRHAIKKGSWAFYIPSLELKLLHAMDDCVNCVHRSAPTREEVFSGRAHVDDSRYSLEDWAKAFSKSSLTRAVENYVTAKRLSDAGLGPEPFGLCVVQRFTEDYGAAPCRTAGIFIRNISGYPRKKDTTVDELMAAGVMPDRVLSCVREQIKGYVSDLNSVVGVTPSESNSLVAEIEEYVRKVVR